MKKLFSSTISKLIIAVIIGILLGLIANEGFMNIVVTVKYILGQIIFFMVPLIILGFVSYSIAKMKDNGVSSRYRLSVLDRGRILRYGNGLHADTSPIH